MVKSYYCDYCNRTFKDHLQARKLHLRSETHRKNREAHYAQYGFQTLDQSERRKPCIKFFKEGKCHYGNRCKYYHTNPDLKILNAPPINNEPAFPPILSEQEVREKVDLWLHRRLQTADMMAIDRTSNGHFPQASALNLPVSLMSLRPADLMTVLPTSWG